jgi:hypothetical protein
LLRKKPAVERSLFFNKARLSFTPGTAELLGSLPGAGGCLMY